MDDRMASDFFPAALPAVLLIVDADLNIQSVAQEPTGAEEEFDNLVGGSLSTLEDNHPLAVRGIREAVREVLADQRPRHLSERKVSSVGRERIWRVSLFPFTDADHRTLVLIQLLDLLEAHQVWQTLLQTAKLAGVGHLTAGAAHEFNNLLGGISGYSQLAKMTGELKDYQKLAEVVAEVSARSKRLVGDLVQVAQRPSEAYEQVDLHQIVDQLISLTQRQFKKQKITLSNDLSEPLYAHLVPAKLQYCLLQLLIKMKDAMNQGGKISCKASIGAARRIFLQVEDVEGRLPLETAARIFQPLIDPEGTPYREPEAIKDWGLAIVRSILHTLDAEIFLKTSDRGGCILEIGLPLKATIG